MARAGTWTVNGKCRWCGTPTAWVQRADGSYGRPHDAELDSAGRPIVERDSAGKLRPRATERTHKCTGSDAFAAGQSTQQASAETETTATATATGTETTSAQSDAGSIDVDAIVAKVAAQVRGEMIATLERLGIRQETKLVVYRTDGTKLGTSEDPRHKSLPRLVQFIADRQSVYLAGPAGSGKTFAVTQAAAILGLRSAVQPCGGISVGRLLGFATAGGGEVPTLFADYFENGGVLVLDEFDRMPAHVSIALNAALANRVAVIGGRSVKAHADFVIIATGNTDLRGATDEYTAGQCIDLSTIARFAYLDWQYDDDLETAIVRAALDGQDPTPLVAWIRAIRQALSADSTAKVLAGPREAEAMARDLMRGATIRQAADAFVWRGWPEDAVKRYERAHPLPKVEYRKHGK